MVSDEEKKLISKPSVAKMVFMLWKCMLVLLDSVGDLFCQALARSFSKRTPYIVIYTSDKRKFRLWDT